MSARVVFWYDLRTSHWLTVHILSQWEEGKGNWGQGREQKLEAFTAFSRTPTGSRGDVFVIRTSKPIENLWKNGLFWSRYSFVTHSIGRKPRDWGLARSARASGALWATAFGHPSGDVPCASENMACGYWFSKVDLGQIRSEEIVYSRFIKIAIG